MKIIKSIIIITGFLFIKNSFAAIDCKEDITNIIIHKNGIVYFKTDQTCSTGSVWCQIGFADPKQIDRAYSMLLTAQTSKKQVTFVWPDLSS